MKPCAECIQKYGKPLCTHPGCCLFEEESSPKSMEMVGTCRGVKAPAVPLLLSVKRTK